MANRGDKIQKMKGRSTWTAPQRANKHRVFRHINFPHLKRVASLGVYRYEKESGRADSPNTSCLSPYLHWGQISPRWLLWDAKSARCRPQKFQRKLAWRDLAYWQLSLFPALPWESLRPAYKVGPGWGDALEVCHYKVGPGWGGRAGGLSLPACMCCTDCQSH